MDFSWFTGLFDTPLHTAGQLIGIAALTAAITSYQMKTRKKIVFMQIVSCTLFAVHFFMIGAAIGGALNVIAAARAVVFFFKEKPWFKNAVMVPLFCAVCVVSVILIWDADDGLFNLLPLAGMLFTTFSVASSSPKAVRGFALPSSPLWIVYNYCKGSFSGVATELFVMTSIIVAIVRLDLNRSKKNGAGGGD